MKNKEIYRVLVGTLAASVVLTPLSSNMDTVNAEVLSNSYLDSSGENFQSEYVYLSDLDYIKEWSNSPATIMKDANVEGKKISLLSGKFPLTFDKGLGAHANSTLIYDVSSLSGIYSRFVAYLGVDYSKYGYGGNGVKFTISVSNDGKEWKVIKETEALTAESETVFVDLDISNVKYLKLYADNNGESSYDHSVYGDAKLVTKDYNLYIPGLKTVSEYDDILKCNTIKENLEKNESLILKRALVDRVGYVNLQSLYRLSEDYKEGINFLLNNDVALKYFVTNGEATIDGNYLSSIKSFCNIYNKYKEQLENPSDDYFNLRLAVSISLAYSRDVLVRFWITSEKEINAVTRYEVYQRLVASGIMDKAGNTTTYGKWSTDQFKALPIPLMKWVVDTRMNDDEIEWLAEYALSKKSGTSSSSFLDAYSYINYTFDYNYDKSILYDMDNYDYYNNKYNFSKYYSDYGTRNVYRLWMIFEEGSVCGGLAKTYANLAEVFGRPSSVVGQPGHAATITYGWNSSTNQYEWYLQNDISGWAESGNEYKDRMLNWGNRSWCTGYSASYLPLATDAIETKEAYSKFVQATLINLLADSYDDLDKKEEAYRKALENQSINLDSFEGLVKVYKANNSKTSADYIELAKMVVDAYTYYPLVMSDLLNYLSSGVTDSQDVILLDLLRTNALTKAKVATASNVKQPGIANTMANFLLGNVSVDLASFSFDGANAGTIMINDKYKDSEIRIRYSLDGQKTWKETNEHEIKLSEDELSKINATDDIVVGLVGTNDVFTIDILEGVKATNATLYRNDLENRLYGRTDNLLISLDEGQTWCDYTPDMRFTGRQVVKVKYKAYGVYLESGVEQYTFTEDTDTDTKKYISIDHLSVIDYSSRTNESESGENVISGSINDGWHSAANDTQKYITLKLDSVKYITAIDYVSSFNSGKIKNADILTSLDGVNWVKSGSISDWQNNADLKTATLYEPTAARYVKIVATETHGGNSYFTCKMLNFYEDTTKTYEVHPIIDYSETTDTNKDVVAKLVLPEGCQLVGEGEYTFEENGTYTFTYLDANDEEKTIDASVTWIDKEAPNVSVEYDINELTNKSVTATLVGLESGDKILSDGGASHVFDSNGEFEFVVQDSVGNEKRITAKVDWIDRTTPTATVKYSVDSWTNGNVIATIVSDGKNITVTNTDNNSNSYVFDKNGTFKFEFVDEAGNKGEAIAEVNWIDKVAPTATVRYSTKNPTTGSVTVELIGFSEDGVTVKNNENKTTYTFNNNGEFEFVIVDRAGNETKVPVKVDWISETAPNIDVEYSTRDFTNQNVTATLKGLPEGYDVVNEGGSTSYVFEDNGSYEFKVRDRDGNILTVVAEVSWIDKVAPSATIVYSTSSLTNQDVVATVQGFNEEGVTIKNNNGNYSYSFKENGYFNFVLVDKAGNETVIRAEVNNIDKVVPTAKVVFESSGIKDGKVIAKLTDLSEEVTIINTVNGNDYYEFTENGTFTFIFKDKAGNIGEAEAIVDWINFEDLCNLVKFENLAVVDSSNDSSDPNTPDYVRATFSIGDNIEILNNGGSNTVVFDKNGTFTFKARMRNTGYEFDMTITVDWLSDTVSEEENPVIDSELLPPVVVLPSVDEDEDIPSKGDDSNDSSDEEVNPDGDNSNSSTDDKLPPVVDEDEDIPSKGDDSNDSSDEEVNPDGDNSNSSTDDKLPPVEDEDKGNSNTDDDSVTDGDKDDATSDEEIVPPVNLDNGNSSNVDNEPTEENEDTSNNESTDENIDSFINSSSSSTKPSIENSNTEVSLGNSSVKDSSYEESSHKGSFATVASTVSVTLAAIFVWIRKLFGFRK